MIYVEIKNQILHWYLRNITLVLKIYKDGYKTVVIEKKVLINFISGCGRKMKDINMEKNLIKWINL